jgi:hypothetical protein
LESAARTRSVGMISSPSGRHALLDLGARFGTRTIKGLLYPATTGAPTQYVVVCDCGAVDFQTKYRAQQPRTCSKCDLEKRLRNKPSPRRSPDAAFNELFAAYKRAARERSLEFALDRETFAALTRGDCAYCGAAPRLYRVTKFNPGTGYVGSYQYNGVDRVDSKQGYLPHNVVTSCKTCNYMKRTMSREEFLGHVRRIASRYPA